MISSISSLSNPIVKRLRLLHEHRGRRREHGYLIEGVRLIEAALDSRVLPSIVLVEPAALRATARGRALHDRLLHQAGMPTPLDVSPAVLRHVCATETPAGVVASVPLPASRVLDDLPHDRGLAVVLDGVQDPGNAGAILRTSAAARIDAVVALKGCVDLFAPKVVRAGMGAHFQIALLTDIGVADLAPWTRARGYALAADASALTSVFETDLRSPIVLIVGSEANGVRSTESLSGVRRVAIPMPGAVESLNVASATAVILFEALRQRQAGDAWQPSSGPAAPPI